MTDDCGCCGDPRGCCRSWPGQPHDLATCTASPAMRDAMADHDEMFHLAGRDSGGDTVITFAAGVTVTAFGGDASLTRP